MHGGGNVFSLQFSFLLILTVVGWVPPGSRLWDRLACSTFVRVSLWYQHLWKEGDGSRVEQREGLSRGRIWAVMQSQQRPQPTLGELWGWMDIQKCPKLGGRELAFYFHVDQLWRWTAPRERHDLEQSSFLQPRKGWQLKAVSGQHSQQLGE